MRFWPGRSLVLAALAPGLLSLTLLIPEMDGMRPWLVGLDTLILGFALVDLATLRGAGRISASRSCDSVASLGEPFTVSLTITNPSPSRWSLRVKDDLPESFEAEPSEFALELGGHESASLESRVVPKRRGSYRSRRVDLLVSSRFGFWRRVLRVAALTRVRVYPDVRQIARYTMLARRDRLSLLGVRRSRRLGTDNEFERLRDYVPGDEPRHLDWRASARRQKLTVRAFQATQNQRILFLIDCGRMMAGDTGGGLSPLDHALNAMLLLAHVALTRGDQVGLLAYDDGLRVFVPPRGGPSRVNALVAAVHDLFPRLVESRHDRAFVELEHRCRKRSLVVLLTNLIDDVNAEQVSGHLGRLVGRHLPLAVFLRDHDLFRMADAATEDGPNLYRGAAAASLLNWRERVLADLEARGALTLDVFPEALTATLVNTYLQVKARHLL